MKEEGEIEEIEGEGYREDLGESKVGPEVRYRADSTWERGYSL